MNSVVSKFFGDKAFYKKVLLLVVPIIVQNAITNFVSMLDNINRILDRVALYIG